MSLGPNDLNVKANVEFKADAASLKKMENQVSNAFVKGGLKGARQAAAQFNAVLENATGNAAGGNSNVGGGGGRTRRGRSARSSSGGGRGGGNGGGGAAGGADGPSESEGRKLYENMKKSARASADLKDNMGKAANEADAFAKHMKRSESFFAGISKRISSFLRFSIASFIVTQVTQPLLDAAQAVIDLDTAQNKLQQVTNRSKGEVKDLTDEVLALGRELGITTSKLIEADLILAQAGFGLQTIRQLNDLLAKTELAPSFDSLESTSEGLIATFNQFRISTNDSAQAIDAAEQFLNVINEVSKQFPVEAGNIIEAVRNAGSVFASAEGLIDSAGNSIDRNIDSFKEFVAVFSTVRSTSRLSSSTIATGLRTVIQRLQRQKTSTDLEEIFGATVSLRDSKGEFIGVAESFQKIGDAIKNAGFKETSQEVSTIVETLGGIRQAKIVLPLLFNTELFEDISDAAENSFNSIEEDAATAQERLQVKINKVKKEFFSIFVQISQSDIFRDLIDSSFIFLNSLKNIVGVLESLAGFAPVIAAIKLTQFIGNKAGPVGGLSEGFKSLGLVKGERFSGATGGVSSGLLGTLAYGLGLPNEKIDGSIKNRVLSGLVNERNNKINNDKRIANFALKNNISLEAAQSILYRKTAGEAAVTDPRLGGRFTNARQSARQNALRRVNEYIRNDLSRIGGNTKRLAVGVVSPFFNPKLTPQGADESNDDYKNRKNQNIDERNRAANRRFIAGAALVAGAQYLESQNPDNRNIVVGSQTLQSGIIGASIGGLLGPWGAAIGGATGAVIGFANALDSFNESKRLQEVENIIAQYPNQTNTVRGAVIGYNDAIASFGEEYITKNKQRYENLDGFAREQAVNNLYKEAQLYAFERTNEQFLNSQEYRDIRDRLNRSGQSEEQYYKTGADADFNLFYENKQKVDRFQRLGAKARNRFASEYIKTDLDPSDDVDEFDFNRAIQGSISSIDEDIAQQKFNLQEASKLRRDAPDVDIKTGLDKKFYTNEIEAYKRNIQKLSEERRQFTTTGRSSRVNPKDTFYTGELKNQIEFDRESSIGLARSTTADLILGQRISAAKLTGTSSLGNIADSFEIRKNDLQNTKGISINELRAAATAPYINTKATQEILATENIRRALPKLQDAAIKFQGGDDEKIDLFLSELNKLTNDYPSEATEELKNYVRNLDEAGKPEEFVDILQTDELQNILTKYNQASLEYAQLQTDLSIKNIERFTAYSNELQAAISSKTDSDLSNIQRFGDLRRQVGGFRNPYDIQTNTGLNDRLNRLTGGVNDVTTIDAVIKQRAAELRQQENNIAANPDLLNDPANRDALNNTRTELENFQKALALIASDTTNFDNAILQANEALSAFYESQRQGLSIYDTLAGSGADSTKVLNDVKLGTQLVQKLLQGNFKFSDIVNEDNARAINTVKQFLSEDRRRQLEAAQSAAALGAGGQDILDALEQVFQSTVGNANVVPAAEQQLRDQQSQLIEAQIKRMEEAQNVLNAQNEQVILDLQAAYTNMSKIFNNANLYAFTQPGVDKMSESMGMFGKAVDGLSNAKINITGEMVVTVTYDKTAEQRIQSAVAVETEKMVRPLVANIGKLELGLKNAGII